MSSLYPLRFEPIFRRYLWGGRKLGALLGKAIGEGNDYAESWEVVDRDDDQSRVAAGPLAGVSLGELVKNRGEELLGRHHPQSRFPLLFKFLDCAKVLSVQVHPSDEIAAKMNPPDFGKTEAWVVVAAEPGSLIYAGLKRGMDRAALEREVQRGTCELCLNRFEPEPGDCLFLPAGMLHSLGAGLVIAEIQQSSDVTYRLFDWNRLGPDGQPRPLHVREALEAINYKLVGIRPQTPQPTGRTSVERLVECDKFVLDRWRIDEPLQLDADGRFHILSVLEGAVNASGDPSGEPLKMGQTMLLPATVDGCRLEPLATTTILDIYLP